MGLFMFTGGYMVRYFHLNYQGFTRKEITVVKRATGKPVKCVNPVTGVKNLIKFYFDMENVESELLRMHSTDEYESISLNETTDAV